MKENLPKVLIMSINAWQDHSPNHTLSDIFSWWDKDKLAHIYVRAGLPATNGCNRFLRISENSVIKSVIRRNIKTAKVVENCLGEPDEKEKAELLREQKRYGKRKKKYSWPNAVLREVVWSLGRWKTKELRRFVDEFDPDVIFLQVHSVVYMSRIQNYIIKYTGKPVVCYFTDDSYSYVNCIGKPWAMVHRFFLRKQIKKLMKRCNKLFVMAPKAAEICSEMFSKECDILTKAVDYTNLSYKEAEVSDPIKMIYTGRLVIGRPHALIRIAKAVENINRDRIRLALDVYSSDDLDEEILQGLQCKGVRFMGSVAREETERLQKESDVVLFVESLEKSSINTARVSFSTKITDYFASGRCIFALGSKEIAPMDYMIKEDAAIAVTDYDDIEDALRKLCDNPDLIKEYGKKAFDCGKRNHDAQKVYSKFIDTMCEVAKAEN